MGHLLLTFSSMLCRCADIFFPLVDEDWLPSGGNFGSIAPCAHFLILPFHLLHMGSYGGTASSPPSMLFARLPPPPSRHGPGQHLQRTDKSPPFFLRLCPVSLRLKINKRSLFQGVLQELLAVFPPFFFTSALRCIWQTADSLSSSQLPPGARSYRAE